VRRQLRAIVALVAASLVFQTCFITLDAFHSDEGLVLVAAADVAKGRLLYRDCYVPLTPGVYLLQGVAFKLAGSRFIVSRLLMAGAYAATVATVFSIAGCLLPVPWALLAGAIAIPFQLWMWPHAQFFSYNALATLLCLVAIRLAWSIEARGGRPRDAAAFGAVLALALWTKPNLAVATGAGVLLYWIAGWLRTRPGASGVRGRGWRELLREGGAGAAGAALASAPLVAYLVWAGIFDDMLESLYSLSRIYAEVPVGLFPALYPATGQLDAVRLFPGRVLPGVVHIAVWNDLAFRYLLDHSGWVDLGVRILYYAPIGLYLAVAACLTRRLISRRWEPRDEAALLLFCAALAFYSTVVPHPALHYMMPTLLPLVPLVLYVGWRLDEGARGRWRLVLRVAGATLVLGYGAVSFGALSVYLGVPREPVRTSAGTLWLPRDNARRWNAVFEYLRERVPEGAPVFTVPYSPMLHFLTGYDHPTRYTDLRPGSPGPAAEDEIMQRLERESVQWVAYFPGTQFPAIERWESAYPRLQRYVEARFERQRSFPGPFGTFAEVWRRRPAAGQAKGASGRQEP
jgi:hypothetical protein